MLLRLGLRSGLIVPLIAHGRILGAISVGMTESNRQFRAGDIQVALDLANRAALAVDNARLYQEAQTAIHVRDEFLSIAAHELRTPMTALFGYTQLLRDRLSLGTATSDRDRQMVGIMVEQGTRLMRLLDTLLDLSRLDTGHFSLNTHVLDLGVLVSQAVAEFRLMTDQHQIELELPATPEPILIDGDEQRLEQVFTNLFQNAIKYSPAGGSIFVRMGLLAAEVEVTITDQGIGIPAADIPHLFERYFRARTSELSSVGGLGIGLYVVHEIVARHGGSVTVQSEQWQGSTFTIRLPRYSADGLAS
jgi:signal transduction histidine kinase